MFGTAKLQHFSEILIDVKRFIFPMIGWGVSVLLNMHDDGCRGVPCVRSVPLNLRALSISVQLNMHSFGAFSVLLNMYDDDICNGYLRSVHEVRPYPITLHKLMFAERTINRLH